MGFDEILLDWFLYPIGGDQSALELPADKTVVLKDFAQALEKQLAGGRRCCPWLLREPPSADNGVTAELLASCFDPGCMLMPDAERVGRCPPAMTRRATRVATMAGYAPESGSYLVTQ